ncbi:MAG TPA: fibronectin type III domain-containing protein [Acidimicrobiia bacterium]|nr:fibronectin type III domain-containing protein [Acidimicrobiia bacterium]
MYTSAAHAVTQIPAPTNLRVNVGQNQVTLTWDKPEPPRGTIITNFRIEYSLSEAAPNWVIVTHPFLTDSTYSVALNTDVSPAVNVAVRVTAIDGRGVAGIPSEPIQFSIGHSAPAPPVDPPDPPNPEDTPDPNRGSGTTEQEDDLDTIVFNKSITQRAEITTSTPEDFEQSELYPEVSGKATVPPGTKTTVLGKNEVNPISRIKSKSQVVPDAPVNNNNNTRNYLIVLITGLIGSGGFAGFKKFGLRNPFGSKSFY